MGQSLLVDGPAMSVRSFLAVKCEMTTCLFRFGPSIRPNGRILQSALCTGSNLAYKIRFGEWISRAPTSFF